MKKTRVKMGNGKIKNKKFAIKLLRYGILTSNIEKAYRRHYQGKKNKTM